MVITTKMHESMVHQMMFDLERAGFDVVTIAMLPKAKSHELVVNGDKKAVSDWLKNSRYVAKVK